MSQFRIYVNLDSYGVSPINITFLSFAYFFLLWLAFITCCVTNCHTIKLWYDVSGEGLRQTRKSQPEIKVVLPLFHPPLAPLWKPFKEKRQSYGLRLEVGGITTYTFRSRRAMRQVYPVGPLLFRWIPGREAANRCSLKQTYYIKHTTTAYFCLLPHLPPTDHIV